MDREHLFSAKPPENFYLQMQRLLTNKGKNEKKRRFNDDQIRLLETMFQTQTKLEPKQKLELARELGLQPRQVSIWFQNKRARWKSKQLEKEYSVLKSNYDGLLKSVESLRKENQFLTSQLEKLREMVEQQSDKTDHSSSQREELESVRQECVDGIKYFEGNDVGCLGIVGQGNVSELELDLDYGAYQDQFCTNNVELWDHWPLTELNSVA
ncbi:Homeobox leucine zipper family protein [Rhynchospora pubera]|uniref:Homeobox-leucine zipper protein n=1 Tax=Rhynchospora pubera TaxID=906938 RepID=A0AAV8H7N9_9POAL|nr:Homeobox leucine zipper family protein [Rhynchospora pubera]